jgi:cation:H+ antiporter
VTAVSTGAIYGNGKLAVSTLLGSLAFNVFILSLADASRCGPALSSLTRGPSSLLQGLLTVVGLALVAIAISSGDVQIGGLGCWTLAICVFAILSFIFASRYSSRTPWRPDLADDASDAVEQSLRRLPATRHGSVMRLLLWITAYSAVILVAGYLLSRTGDALSRQTGLGGSFVGFLLVGVGSSMPEAASVISAAHLGAYDMAFGDVFGTNLFNLALLVLADIFYPDGPILNQAGRFELVATLLALTLTAVYLVGIINRQRATLLHLGYDSWIVAIGYFGGMALLYLLR